MKLRETNKDGFVIKNIVFLADDFPPFSKGGASISTYELVQGALKEGHNVSVITTSRDWKSQDLVIEGVRVHWIFTNYDTQYRAWKGLYNKQAIRELKELLDVIRPDIIHVNNVHQYLSWASIKVCSKYARTIVTLRDTMAITYGKLKTDRFLRNRNTKISFIDNIKQARKRYNPFRNLIIRYYLKHADTIQALSKLQKKALEDNGIKNVSLARVAVDIERYPIGEEEIKYDIFFGGRLSKDKGSEFFDDALKYFDKPLKIARPNMESWRSHEDTLDLIRQSKIVVVPSLYLDAYARTIIEAMALGKPVITTKYTGGSEIITHGRDGYITETEKPEYLFHCMRYVLDTQEYMDLLGKNARQTIINHYKIKERVYRDYQGWHEEEDV